ncbi:MAG TPA: amino acid adenylation domain-containing protein [Longimicrobium sp.]|nr:amino acid adenylation domain-containing protein [Longimicrobium sp.]
MVDTSARPQPLVHDAYPLTPLQQGMLFQSLLAPGVNVEQVVCRLAEPVDAERLARAWSRVARRHDVLRTRFRWADVPEPVQEVVGEAPLEIARHDWSGLVPAAWTARLDEWLAQDRARGFSLGRAPAARLALFALAPGDHALVWSFHHLLLDGRSVGHVLREVFALYDAAGDDGVELPERRPFREHVAWLHARDGAGDRAYWAGVLAGVEAPPPLRVGRASPRDPAVEPPSGERELALAESATAALRAFEAEQGVWLNSLVQGAWALLLGRYTGAAEAVFGVVRSGRGTGVPGAEGMVGLLINTVPVRVPLPARARVIDWLEEIGERSAAVLPHEHAAAADIRRWSGLPPGAELFDTVLNFQPQPFDAPLRALGGPWLGRSFRVRRQPGLPLAVEVAAGERLMVRIQYDAGLFDAGAVDRMLGHFAHLLGAIIAGPDAPLGRRALAGPAERAALVAAGRGGRASGVQAPAHRRFERRAAERPDAPAVAWGDAALSYGELNARANRLAHRLRALGVGPETRVGIALERSPELVAAALAVLKAGGAYLPLDPAYPPERIAWMLEDADAAVLVTEASLLGRLPPCRLTALCLDRDADAIAREPADDPAGGAPPEALAYVIYTSGSTGRPKGVCVTHACLADFLAAAEAELAMGPADVTAALASFAFDVWVLEVLLPLVTGGATRLVRQEDVVDPEAGVRELEGVTTLYAVPTLLRQVVERVRESRRATLPAMRRVVGGGDVVGAALLRDLRRVFPRAALRVFYGPTEATVSVSSHAAADAAEERNLIGRPLRGVELHVCDAAGEPAPAGVAGHLLIGGRTVARGYLGRPGLTAEHFVPDPFAGEPGARLYRSGDRARRLPSGELEFLGRLDQQVKVRGVRIDPGEIECVLLEHPAVARAVVTARPDAAAGVRLAAYVEPRAGARPGAAELRLHLRRRLAEAAVPAALVVLDRLPLTPSGKVDRQGLPASGSGEEGPYVAPRTATERALAAVWAEVLGVERVGAADGFIALGGDSLRAMQAMARIQRELACELGMRVLMERSSLAEVAAAVEAERAAAPAAPPIARRTRHARPVA